DYSILTTVYWNHCAEAFTLQRFRLMNDIFYEKVVARAGKHQVVIFVHPKKETEQDLKDLLPYGFAIHHAGMARSDHELVEILFGQGDVQVLVSAATLAWGVNLPAHTVIIKRTQIYNPEKGAWTELSPLDIIQMLGRAGRPQYHTSGERIIITGHSELRYYRLLMNNQLPIESQFVSKLADQPDAEIVLGTVQSAKEAFNWLSYSYLYIRMLRIQLFMIHSAATVLVKNNLVKYNQKSGSFQVTDLGRIASHYYISHGTISSYNEHLKPTMGDIELSQLFSLSEEFKYVTVRQDEKMELAKLLNLVPIPVMESLKNPALKSMFCSKPTFHNCFKKRMAQVAEKALNLCKLVGKQMWNVQTPLRQFHGIPKRNFSWERYHDLSSQEIEKFTGQPQLGKLLHKYIHQFPKLNLATHIQPITRTVLRVELTITPDFMWEDRVHGYVEPFWVIAEDNDGEFILHHKYFMLKKQYIDEDYMLNFTLLNSQSVLPVSFRHLILPEKYHLPTELLDLQPLPVTALRNPEFEALYQEFKHFNPIQTQVFTVSYNTDLDSSTDMKWKNHLCRVCSLAKERYHVWEQKFGKGLGFRVVELTGELATDLKLLEKGQIVISTPEKWDSLSRRWKVRKHVQQVSLFIIDELHLIGGQGGHILEVIVSRMRYIASCNLSENRIRIMALSTSLANAKDLGEWIGATPHGLFNFSPSVRVDIANFEARMQAMTRPTYTAIVEHARNGKPALVFVPTRKHASLTRPLFFLKSEEELEPFISKVNEPMLSATHLVVVMGTQYHDGRENIHTDYPVADLLQMMGHATRPLPDTLPVESHLQHYLHDNLSAEVVSGVICNKQDAVDYITWTFIHRHISVHLSELVENTMSDMEASKCVSVKEGVDLYPLNLGMVASYYCISYTTMEQFNSSLASKTKIKGLLEILASATEYAELPLRPGEEELIRRLINHQRYSFENPKCTNPHVKANALLQAHFSRHTVVGNLVSDQREILLSASRLLRAMVDLISSSGQLPHFTRELAKKCQENPGKSIETVYDLVEMDDDKGQDLLQMSDLQLLGIARFCDRFPNIEMTYEVLESDHVISGDDVSVKVTLERDLRGTSEVGPVDAPGYQKCKEEGWRLVLGDGKTNQLLAIKRVYLQRKAKVKLEFSAPSEAGRKSYTLYFMCDSYLGSDQGPRVKFHN
ncbi:hypothetical protein MKW92_022713, partial [Papaver armeniacum]